MRVRRAAALAQTSVSVSAALMSDARPVASTGDCRMRVAVVTEYYPRRDDPVLGVWAHRQALAARAAGAEVEVFVLHRVVPPRNAAWRLVRLLRQPAFSVMDDLMVRYVRYV